MPRRIFRRKHKGKRRPDTEESTSLTQNPLSTTNISPENVLDLQRTIGNQATRKLIQSKPTVSDNSTNPFASLVMRVPIISAASPMTPTIQRASLDDLQEQLESAQTAFKRKQTGSKAWTKLKNRIERLESKIEEAQSSDTPETTPEPEVTPEPFKEKYPALANTFSEEQIEALDTAVGETRMGTLLKKYDSSKIKGWVDALGTAKFADMVTTFKNYKIDFFSARFSLEQMKDLFSVYGASALNNMFTKIHPDKIKDILAHFTAQEFSDFTTAVGRSKLIQLVNVREIGGAALKHYSTGFFKVFAGAGTHTMNHLLTVKTKNNGTISGGHDAVVFYPELNKKVGRMRQRDDNNRPYWVDVPNGQVTGENEGSVYDKVWYDTYYGNGNQRASGSKTLIHNLQSNQSEWLTKANEAVWKAINDKTFPENGGAWSGDSKDGTSLRGFYTPSVSQSQIATFFPV